MLPPQPFFPEGRIITFPESLKTRVQGGSVNPICYCFKRPEGYIKRELNSFGNEGESMKASGER